MKTLLFVFVIACSGGGNCQDVVDGGQGAWLNGYENPTHRICFDSDGEIVSVKELDQ